MLVLALAIGFSDINSYAASIRLNKKTATITVGKTLKLKVTGTRKKVKWSSTNKSVCTVSSSGTVKGKKAGTAEVRAKAGKKTLSCKVTVKAKPVVVKPITATGLTIQAPYTKLAPGGTVQLSYGFIPSNAKQEAVAWESSSSGRASVSETGLVTAKGKGDVTITVRLKSNRNISAKITLIIETLTVEGTVKTEDGGDLLLSEPSSRAVYTGTVSYAVPDVRVEVVDDIGKVIRTYPQGAKDQKTPISVAWDLKDASGSLVSPGSYCFQLVAAGVVKKSQTFTVYADSEFGSGNGNGSASSPYLISSVEQLGLIWNHNGMNFKQTQNIDFGINPCSPMFTTDEPFTGTYDGDGFQIAGINHVTELDNQALFCAIGEKGTVKNLTVADSIFKGANRLAAIAAVNYGTIENCIATNCQIVTTSGKAGFISCENYGTIKNCKTSRNKASITGRYIGIGSICAWNGGTILNCTSGTSNAEEKDSMAMHPDHYKDCYMGGIAGENEGSIISCTVKSVEIKCDYGTGVRTAGGIIGWNGGIYLNNSYGGSDYPQVGYE